jgi:PAS domain S-box-containing protein
MLDHAPDIVIIADMDGRCLEINHHAAELLGYTAEEASSMHLRELMAPESLPAFDERLKNLQIGDSYNAERLLLRKDGTQVPVEGSVHVLAGGHVLIFLRDISRRKRAQAAIHESEQRYRQMFERNQAVKLLIDPETGAILDANPAASQFYGYTLDGLKQMNITQINTLAPDEVAAEMARAASEKRSYFNFQHKLASGEVRNVEVHSSPLDIGGQTLLFSIIHDITERKQAEREVQTLTSELERRVAERTAQLEAINMELEAEIAERKQAEDERNQLLSQLQTAVRTREELLSIVSHDLKNPLGVIKGFSQLLQRRLARGAALESTDVAGALTKIDDAANKMHKLIDELLDFARLQADQPLNLELEPMDLIGLVRRAAAEAQQATNRHDIRVEAAVPAIVGRWDAARLEQVLGNLLSNAVKYSNDGTEITVTLRREDAEAGMDGNDPEASEWAVVSVSDRGIGIPADDLPHIFEWYHRASNVSDQVSGAGIGLASARQILKQHGGTISVSSREGEGSTFTVRLPLDGSS